MEEGYSTNKPPLFKGIKYDYQKERMIAHFEFIHIDLWDTVEYGNYMPLYNQLNKVPRTSWANAQRQRLLLNYKAQNTLLCPLSKEEYTKIHSYRSAKQMWDTLSSFAPRQTTIHLLSLDEGFYKLVVYYNIFHCEKV